MAREHVGLFFKASQLHVYKHVGVWIVFFFEKSLAWIPESGDARTTAPVSRLSVSEAVFSPFLNNCRFRFSKNNFN